MPPIISVVVVSAQLLFITNLCLKIVVVGGYLYYHHVVVVGGYLYYHHVVVVSTRPAIIICSIVGTITGWFNFKSVAPTTNNGFEDKLISFVRTSFFVVGVSLHANVFASRQQL